MNKKVSNSSKRLQEMMETMKLKQTDIVRTTGITKSALSNYLHGTREPRQDQISRIADPYHINPTWLMGYDVPMYIEQMGGTSIEPNQEQLIAAYLLKLNEDGFNEVLKRLEELTQLEKYKKDEK